MTVDEKVRLDILLVQNGMATSREKAKALILSGGVLVNGVKQKKPSLAVPVSSQLERLSPTLRYVSRGGLKLEKMVAKHGLDFSGMTCIDICASTGGFTDCMLQNGAEKVYAVDVGHDQLAAKLRTDRRVVNLEGRNIRCVTKSDIPEPIAFGSVDVSFISLALVLPVLHALLLEGGTAVCLVKPQFEAGKGRVGKKGVVKDPKIHLMVLEQLYDVCISLGFSVLDAEYSPVRGSDGNIEYLFYLGKNMNRAALERAELKGIVKRSHII